MFGISDIWWVVINSVVAFSYLFIISKILGKKQIAQLEFIDYAVGISLGSIAAEMATETNEPFYNYLIGMSIFFVLALFVAILGRKNTFFKRIFKGKPATLVYEGRINYDALKKCKIDVNDLLSMLREKNFFDINDVAYAIFEPSGKLSVLPKSAQRPLVLEDLPASCLSPAADTARQSLTNILIVDGVVSKSGLNEIKKDSAWLFKKLKISKKSALKDILLAVYDDKTRQIVVHKKEKSV